MWDQWISEVQLVKNVVKADFSRDLLTVIHENALFSFICSSFHTIQIVSYESFFFVDGILHKKTDKKEESTDSCSLCSLHFCRFLLLFCAKYHP